MPANGIILACKVSNVQDLIAVYTELARRCDYPLHLGLTEAGMGSKGIVASTAALAVLLQRGIGDTIRISLTPEPNGDRTRRSSSPGKSCRRWACARSRRWSARARMRPDDERRIPGARREHPDLSSRAHAANGESAIRASRR
jgi:hypothetical protein